jgi:hypothetical protein
MQMNKLLLTLAMAGLAAWQANASLVGTTASYNLYNDGGYNGDGTPYLGSTLRGSGTATWTSVDLTSVGYPGYVLPVATPSGNPTGYNWFPFGNTAFTAMLTCQFIAPTAGSYSFGTYSDDGSALYVDGNLIVNNGWEHGHIGVMAAASLSAGIHTLVATFRENGEGQSVFDVISDPKLVPVPEPSTFIAGALLALPFGLHGVRNLRNRKQTA